jgi:hypothetical protein
MERVIQITINPIELWDVPKEVWHLSIIIRFIVISCSDWIEGFVQIGVNNLITQIVMRFLPEILWEVG